MFLDNTGMSLQGVLSGAASPAPVFTVGYVVHGVSGAVSKPALSRGSFNGATDVTLLAAPGLAGEVREVLFVSIYNADNASITVTVKTDDGTEGTILTVTLLTLEHLFYEKGRGWYSMDVNGELKTA